MSKPHLPGASGGEENRPGQDAPLLQIEHLKKNFEMRKGMWRRRVGVIRAVNDVSFSILRGETLGLVGESGCGKTTTGRCIIRAIDPSDGAVRYRNGRTAVDIVSAPPATLRRLRCEIRMIFQDPFSSLNPRMNVQQIIGEPLLVNKIASSRREIEESAAAVMKDVGLDPRYMRRFPHAFSGGQRQRIAIARALVLRPRFIIADEPVSALDVSIQAQIINLLQRLKREHRLTYLFIAHNLAVVEHVSERVAVMYLGRIVELATTEALFSEPRHPYTEALLSAVPVPDPDHRKDRIVLQGEVPSLLQPPTGCLFHPRCPYAEEICSREEPPLVDVQDTGESRHLAACHFADRLRLRGMSS